MKMCKVESSNIREIGYDSEKLYVVFKPKKSTTEISMYVYSNVDEKLFKCFLDSDSKGKFFATNIKGKFDYEKVESKEKEPSKPVINSIIKKIHSFVEEKIVDIPGLSEEQKKKIRDYSLDLIAVAIEAAVRGLKEGAKRNRD